MKKNLVRTMALVAAVGVAACGDDDPTSTGDELSEAEAAAVSSIVLGTAFQATAAGIPTATPAAAGPQAVPFSYSADIETTVACTGGGSIALDGSATVAGDDETSEFTIAYNLNTTYSDCTEFAQEAEQEFTIGGGLNFTANADYSLGQGEGFGNLTSTGTFTGNISWSSEDGRSGTCGVSLTSTTTTSGESITASTTGSFCGVAINETFTYGVST